MLGKQVQNTAPRERALKSMEERKGAGHVASLGTGRATTHQQQAQARREKAKAGCGCVVS